MADVSTQFAIQDRMTSKINAMINASERLNRTLDETDALTESVGDGRNYDEIVDAANRVADALDCMNQRQEDAANKVRKTKSEFQTLADTIQDLPSLLNYRTDIPFYGVPCTVAQLCRWYVDALFHTK